MTSRSLPALRKDGQETAATLGRRRGQGWVSRGARAVRQAAREVVPHPLPGGRGAGAPAQPCAAASRGAAVPPARKVPGRPGSAAGAAGVCQQGRREGARGRSSEAAPHGEWLRLWKRAYS